MAWRLDTVAALRLKYSSENSLMRIENQTFYGRENDIDKLFQAWLDARVGKPQWVSLIAETGTGKTRLIHELYRYISDRAYRLAKAPPHAAGTGWDKDYDPTNYWPNQLPMASNMLGLNPDPEQLTDKKIESLDDIPWLWWGMRGDPGRRNGSENGCAARDALGKLEIHAALSALLKARKEANMEAGIEITKALLGVLGGAPLLELAATARDLVVSGKIPFQTLRRGYGFYAKEEAKKLQVKLQDMLVDTIVEFLEHGVPVVLILDDVHFLDQDSQAFVDALSTRLVHRHYKLLIISTSWAKEWRDGAVCPGYQSFTGKKSPLTLDRTDPEHVRKFFLSHFPGLSADDQKLLMDKANGNFGYATELVLAMEADVKFLFEGKNGTNTLSSNGRKAVGEMSLDMDKLVHNRFVNLHDSIQTALMRSSYQGVRFDPGLTARVTDAIDQDDPGAGATITAIGLAEQPGAMVCSVDADLREFLQGPYWRLIRKRLDGSDIDEVAEAYRRLLTSNDIALDDSIVESLVGQCLAREDDQVQQLHWRACLLELAVKERRYHAGLHQLSAMADLMVTLKSRPDVDRKGRLLSPRSAVAALRIFNQYAFGGGNQDKRLALQDFCEHIACETLQEPIQTYLQQGELPPGCDLSDLIAWCETLVGLRQSLGHMHDAVKWLGFLTDLLQKQVEGGAPAPNAHFGYATGLLRLAEAYFPYHIGNGSLAKVLDIALRAEAGAGELSGAHHAVVRAWVQISKLRFDTNLVHDARSSILGEVLADLASASGTIAASAAGEIDDDLLEALLHTASLSFEEALLAGYTQAAQFLAPVRQLSSAVFSRIEAGAYVPVALTCEAMNAELAAACMHAELAGARNPNAPHGAALPEVICAGRSERKVAFAEALKMTERIDRAMDRHRQLGMLSMDLICAAARLRYNRLLWSGPDPDLAKAVFEDVLADAVLAQDGLRARHTESPQLLELLLKIYFQWLQERTDNELLQQQLFDAYKDCPDWYFNKLVDHLEAHLSTSH